ncbi:D-alanyl-D-alanine carboxypeptidase family protein [Tannockella kyphosi]|uniref:D-alanyl-D-alanine carboxypeptidase family protein n=1 Tax=Tannockella kyphosi TaxID=2899121 RepID=UPI0020118A31|nr:D-alanyl-D-alanine carboxypeptidase family protein [Tannockella kyphosi]
MKKIIGCLLVIVILQDNIYGLGDNAKAMVLMEASTNQVLEQNNPSETLYPASTTKIMTMILLFEALNQGVTSFDTMVSTSEYASGMGGSQVYLETGEQMSVYDLFKSIAIASANDASVVIGEHLGGTIENFVVMMNEKAVALGLENTNFTNATGLHDDNHYTSAYDLAVMASYLIEIGGQDLLDVTSLYDSYIREDNEQPFWLVNTNKLLKTYNVDGLKTGYTSEAGYCLVSTIEKDGMRLIGVLLDEELPDIRNQEMIELLEYGFSQYTKDTLYSQGDQVDILEIENISSNHIDVIVNQDVAIVMKKTETSTIETKISYYEDIGSIFLDTPIGVLEIYKDGVVVEQINLYSKEVVLEDNYFTRVYYTFSQLWH